MSSSARRLAGRSVLWAIGCALLWTGAAHAQQTFKEWLAAADGGDPALHERLIAEQRAFRERVGTDGIRAVIDDLRKQAEALLPPGGSRAGANDKVLALLANLQVFQTGLDQPEDMLGGALAGTDTMSGTELAAAGFAAEIGPAVVRNPFFDMGKSVAQPGYFIAEGDEHEIAIQGNSTSTVDQEIWRIGLIAESALGEENRAAMVATRSVITASKNRWDHFMDNVVAEQFIWETLFNGWIGADGTLTTPPRRQWRIAHPTPVIAYSTEGGTQATARLAVELIGIRRYAAETYEPRSGVSLIGIVPGDRAEKTAWGLLWTRNRYSVGLARQRFDNGDDVVALVLGIDLADRLQKKGEKVRARVTEIDKRFECVRTKIKARIDPNDDAAQLAASQACTE